MLKNVDTTQKNHPENGKYHDLHCRNCRIWSERKLRASDEPEPFNHAASVLCEGLRACASIWLNSNNNDSAGYAWMAYYCQAAADLADAAIFHSYSEDDGKTWLSIENIVPKKDGKPITQHFLEQLDYATMESFIAAYEHTEKPDEEVIKDVRKVLESLISTSQEPDWILHEW